MTDSLYIVVPAYNEEANIRSVVEEWMPVVIAHDGEGASRLVVVDDGSKDHTYQILKEMEKEYPALEVLTKPNGGHGSTILYGYRYALSKNASYVFQTDSDGQTRPDEFEPFWESRRDYPMVIGWRGEREDGLSRVFTTRVLQLVIRLCFHVWIKDANTPYRLMEAQCLEEQLKLVPGDFFLSNVLLTVIYAKKGLGMKFIPITFRPRQGGKNSLNMGRIFHIGRQSLKDFRKLNKEIEADIKA